MAYNEQKASLPPIIEDESDDNLMPMLYRKELGKHDSRSDERPQTGSQGNVNSPSSNGVQMPYNSWKSKNAAFLRSPDTGRDSSDMRSKLGQQLETYPMIVSPQLKQPLLDGNQHYQQTVEPSSHRQADSQYQSRGEGSGFSQLEEQGRYFVPFQENPDPKTFNSPVTNNTRGYFPEHNRTYQDHIYTPQNPLRTINPGHPNHESFKYAQGTERSFNHSNIASTPYVHANGPSSPYKPQHITPHRLQPQMFQSEFNGPLACQGSCCRNNHPVQPVSQVHSYRNEKTQSPHGSPAYNQEYSHRHSVNSHKISCHCHDSSEIMKNKKRESKQEKNTMKKITELSRIVFLQNQQIIELQNQVKKLIELHEKYDDKLKRSDQDHTPKMLSKGEKRMFNLSVIEENQNLMEKVSVGIMTSFIDTTTMKTKGKSKKGSQNNGRRSKSSESSSSTTSVTSSETSESEDEELDKHIRKSKLKKKKSPKAHDDSILLNGLEIQTVAENPPSPSPPSMHLEMQEYGEFSSNTDESDSSDENDGNPIPVSWTFYDKVVGKVNNMLNKSESEDDSNEVRKKTLEQLRKLGIHFVDQDCSPSSKRVTFDSPYNQRPIAESDTSMRMNALAMKYLKEERITQDSPEKIKKIKEKKEKRTEVKRSQRKKSKSGQASGKILDITAIKQQPKLLPKKM